MMRSVADKKGSRRFGISGDSGGHFGSARVRQSPICALLIETGGARFYEGARAPPERGNTLLRRFERANPITRGSLGLAHGKQSSSVMHSLPGLNTIEAFQAWRADASRCLPAALDIARSHGLPHADAELFPTGTNLVVALNDRLVLKLFPPMLRGQFIAECASLAQLRGRLSVPIPEIVLDGEREQWPYLVITRLPGVMGTQAWPVLPEDQKECVLRQIGETIAEVQRVPVGRLSSLQPRWDRFMARQIEGCRARHQRLGLPRKYLDGLDDLLRDAARLIPVNAAPVILTGEYIPENLLLSREGGRWRLSGLIDFGDVFTGWGEYDLLGPSAFMTGGMPRRVRSLFAGFGYSEADIGPALTRRLMALMMLHSASDPIRHICIEDWQQKAGDFGELERLLWPI
jgi:hygromycin-B 7''-O-kinase